MKCLLNNKQYLIECLNEKKVEDYPVFDIDNIINVEKEVHFYRLTSCYLQDIIVKKIVKKYEKSTRYDIFIFFGLANGELLERIFEKYPQNIIIVYEPSNEIVKLWLSKENKEAILMSENIYIVSGEEGKKWYGYFLDNIIRYNNVRHTNFYILPGYQSIWTETAILAFQMYCNHLSNESITKNTVIRFGIGRNRKYLRNLYDLKTQYSALDLCRCFRNSSTGNCAIIISAGPSLEKNIKYLKNFKGKAFIIAVDSAIKVLNSNNIMPDIVVTVDTEKRLDFLKSEFFRSIPLVIETTGNSDIRQIHDGKRFYAATGELYTKEIFKRMEKSIGYLRTGGSVANSAFSFAVQCGYKNIVLVGQDLAYPDNKLHASETYDDKEENKLDDNVAYFEVEDIYGHRVLTERNMDIYRKWFERIISENKQLNVIDATEGGAKIHGTKIEKLVDVLKENFITDKIYDFQEIINKTNPIFSDEELNKYNEICAQLPQRLKKDRKKLVDGILLYENLNRLRERGLQNSKEFKSEYNKICKLNHWLEKYENIELLNMYELEEDYELQDNILDVKENQNDEWNEIIKLGLKYCNRYIDAIDDVLADIHFLINGY